MLHKCCFEPAVTTLSDTALQSAAQLTVAASVLLALWAFGWLGFGQVISLDRLV